MILTALLLGLAGSLHCVGMCSPLAMAVSGISRRAVVNRLVYNTGRILTYGILGALVGAFGAIAGLTPYQSALSAGLGVLLVLLGISGVGTIHIPLLTPALQSMSTLLKSLFGRLVKSRRGVGLLLMGGINGLLPCGLTYLALTFCITLPNAGQGFLYMVLFGMGTLPAMLGVPSLLAMVSTRLQRSFRRTTAMIMILLGSLLLIRSAWVQPHKAGTSAAQANEVICP